MFTLLSSWQSYCESSPGSSAECRTAPSSCRPLDQAKARFPLPELTARVDGPATRLVETRARQHGPCWRVMETGHPSTRAVNSGSGTGLKRLGLSPTIGCYRLHPPSPFSINQSVQKLSYLFYRPTEGRRLSRPFNLRQLISKDII